MIPSKWPIEDILDNDTIFRRVHINDLLNWPDINKIQPNIFRSDPDGMSVNWDKYSTPIETLGIINLENGVLQMNVGSIRKEPDHLDVIHTPIDENRSYSSVLGISPSTKTKARKKLSLLATWAIKPNIPNK